jgi:hypothetical protein
VGRQEQIRRGKARTYRSRRFWALGDRMTAGGRIAEVCYNSTGRRVILILLVGCNASSRYTLLQGMTGLIQVIDRHLRVFASHATTIIFGRRKTTVQGNCYACGNRINVCKGPHPDHLVLPTASGSLDASHPQRSIFQDVFHCSSQPI